MKENFIGDIIAYGKLKICCIYCDKKEVYEENKEPSGEVIRTFADTYVLCLPS